MNESSAFLFPYYGLNPPVLAWADFLVENNEGLTPLHVILSNVDLTKTNLRDEKLAIALLMRAGADPRANKNPITGKRWVDPPSMALPKNKISIPAKSGSTSRIARFGYYDY